MAFKTYQGIYKPNNKTKYKGDVTNVVYRSHWEKCVFMWCDKNSEVLEWSSEEIVIPYLHEVDKKIHRYFVDVYIKYKSGETVLVEIKPDAQTKPPTGNRRTRKYLEEGLTFVQNQCKWRAAQEFAEDRGWKFVIWTEKTLQEMGILQKGPGKQPGTMKPLPRFKKPKKKRINTRKRRRPS